MKFSKYEIRRVIYVMAAVIFILIAGVIYCCYSYDKTGDETASQDWTHSSKETTYPIEGTATEPYISAEITVHITGAVKHPGVYKLNSDSRIDDAVKAAGGFKKSAAKDYLNLAMRLNDCDKIHVPSKKEAQKENNSNDNNDNNAQDNDGSHKKINLNTAAKEELMKLPGIGESKADAIISYRESNGGFKSTEQIMEISGIKDGVYNKIADYITAE